MLRAGLAAAMLVGIVTSRQIIGVPVPVLVAADTERLVAPAIRQVLVGVPSRTRPKGA
jgi:hypothetical protein